MEEKNKTGKEVIQDFDGNSAVVPAIASKWKHHKRGGEYMVHARAILQVADDHLDGSIVIFYVNTEDGSTWVRPVSEFLDGRFEFVPHPWPTKKANILPGYIFEFLKENQCTLVQEEVAHPPCNDCGERISPQDHFMVNNTLWTAVADSDEYLHAWCLSARLKRPLRIEDFSEAKINATHIYLMQSLTSSPKFEEPMPKHRPVNTYRQIGWCGVEGCGLPQYKCPSGSVCEKGHGGAPTLLTAPQKKKEDP
jgi:hypothetical protein